MGHGAPKREQISVPPVIEESWTVEGKELYTYSNEEGGKTEPVDMMSRNFERVRWDSIVNRVMGGWTWCYVGLFEGANVLCAGAECSDAFLFG